MTGGNVPPGLVGVPAREWIWTESVASFFDLQLPPSSHVELIPGSLPVPEKRDELARMLLQVHHWRWLLFLDSDQTFPPDVAARLWGTARRTDAGIVAAPVTRRRKESVQRVGTVNAWHLDAPPGWEPEDPTRVGDDPKLRDYTRAVHAREIDPDGDPFPVDLVGAGATLIRREVVEALEGPPYFPPSLHVQPGHQEDVNFVFRARRAGFGVVVDPGVRVGHVGPCAFQVEDAQGNP